MLTSKIESRQTVDVHYRCRIRIHVSPHLDELDNLLISKAFVSVAIDHSKNCFIWRGENPVWRRSMRSLGIAGEKTGTTSVALLDTQIAATKDIRSFTLHVSKEIDESLPASFGNGRRSTSECPYGHEDYSLHWTIGLLPIHLLPPQNFPNPPNSSTSRSFPRTTKANESMLTEGTPNIAGVREDRTSQRLSARSPLGENTRRTDAGC